MSDVDYTALNEQAKILYDYAYAAGRLVGQNQENSRIAKEHAEAVLIVARQLVATAIKMDDRVDDRVSKQSAARDVNYLLYKCCPATYCPSSGPINTALGHLKLSEAYDLVDTDITALKTKRQQETTR